MKKLISLLLAIVMLVGLLAGCGSKPAETPSEPAKSDAAEPAKSEEAEPAKSEEASAAPSRDDVNVSINMALGSTDPYATNNIQDTIIWWQVYESLMNWNENTGEAEPRLASAYEISDDGLSYTFTLRDDVYFHNGDKMTANDVVFSLKRGMDPTNIKNAYATNMVDAVALDDTHVRVDLSAPYAPLLVNLCYLFILSEREVTEQGAEFGTKTCGAGTGPYMFSEVSLDTKIVLKAFDKYYRGEASIKTVNFNIITDSAAGMVSFESGDIDWYISSVMDAQRIAMEGKYNTETLAANHITFIGVNPESKNEALHNKLVRQAIAYAIDKDAINMAAFEGSAVSADYIFNPDWNAGAGGEIVYSYNPEKAKELLTEAGYPDGVDVGTLICFKGSHFEVCSTAVQGMLAEVGINVELVWEEQATSLADAKSRNYDLTCQGFNCQGDYSNFRQRYHDESGIAFVHMGATDCDINRVNELTDEIAACSDPTERRALGGELNDIIADEAVMIPLLHKAVPFVWAKDLNVVNYPANPVIYEWSWN